MGFIKVEDYKLTLQEVYKKLKREFDEDDDDFELLGEMLNEANKIAVPKAFYRESTVEFIDGKAVIDGVKIESDFVSEKLSGQKCVYPYAITCGTELDDWSKKYTDFIEEFYADQIKELYFAKASVALRKEISEKVGKCASLNPGSLKMWQIDGQKELFEIIKEGNCGIKLMPSWLMVPHKSASGIFYRTDSGFENCSLCPRLNCPNRRAKYEYSGV